MSGVLTKILLIAVIAISCNEDTIDFATQVTTPEPEAPIPAIPIEVEGTENSDEAEYITDDDRDKIGINPDDTVAGLERTFTANPSHAGSAAVDFKQAIVDNTLTMTAEVVDEHRSFTQLVRPVYSSRFKQTGTHGEAMAETFTQEEKGILDILMVIDNSASMEKAQSYVSERLPALLNYVANSNWQIAVTSTDRRDCVRGIITADTPDYEQAFINMIQGLGIKGSNAEEAILMAHRGLQGECQGKTTPWLRENSSVAIILVTDEDHQCYKSLEFTPGSYNPKRKDCRNKREKRAKQLVDLYRPIDEFYSYLKQIRIPGVNAKIYGIINPVDTKEEPKTRYGSTWFRGWYSKEDGRGLFDKYANIYSDSSAYDTILQDISADISIILKDQFTLQHVPSAGTVAVTVTTTDGNTDTLHADDYMVNDTTLTLNHKPPQGAAIEVQYAHNAEPDVKEFALPQLPLRGSVSIEINDDGQITTADPDSYLRAGRTIQFYHAPPKGSILTISYKENKPLRDSLQLGQGRVTKLLVTVDDVEIDTFTFDPLTNLITFDADTLPEEGTVVTATYNAILDEVLSYPLPQHESLRDEDNILCFSADDPLLGINCAWQMIDGKEYVTFDTTEFVPERKVIVRQLLDVDSNNIALQPHYLPATIELQSGDKSCYASDLVIENNIIVLDNHNAQSLCPHLVDGEQLTLTYTYIHLQQTFSVEKAFFDAHTHEYEHWDIKINGEKTTDFKVANHTATFDYQLPPDAIVEIKVSLY